jgi:tetratricopeptide (TPR) repeat protein
MIDLDLWSRGLAMFKLLIASLFLLVSASAALANAQADCADRKRTPPDRSIVTCSEVIRGDARAAWAYINRGNAYRAKGDNDRAIADHTKAIEMKRLQR